jgi:hypothetical protein
VLSAQPFRGRKTAARIFSAAFVFLGIDTNPSLKDVYLYGLFCAGTRRFFLKYARIPAKNRRAPAQKILANINVF